MNSWYTFECLCALRTTGSRVAMGRRLLAQQVKIGAVKSHDAWVRTIISGAEDGARVLRDLRGDVVSVERFTDASVTAAIRIWASIAS